MGFLCEDVFCVCSLWNWKVSVGGRGVGRGYWLTPEAMPKTWSPSFQVLETLGPRAAMWPENSTPRIVGAPGGRGYLPSRWSISMLLSPKALTCGRMSVRYIGGKSRTYFYKKLPFPGSWGLYVSDVEVLEGAFVIFD